MMNPELRVGDTIYKVSYGKVHPLKITNVTPKTLFACADDGKWSHNHRISKDQLDKTSGWRDTNYYSSPQAALKGLEEVRTERAKRLEEVELAINTFKKEHSLP